MRYSELLNESNSNIMYHVTNPEYRDSIQRDGLLIDKDNTGQGGVFLADTMKPNGIPGMDIWKVDVSGLELEDDWSGEPDEGEQWYICFDDIPPSRLNLVNSSE